MIANEPNTETFASLFAESISKQEMRTGEVITAEVVRIDQNHVIVNAGPCIHNYVILIYSHDFGSDHFSCPHFLFRYRFSEK